MLARLKYKSTVSNDFSQYTYWGNAYETVVYLDINFDRSSIETFEELDENEIGGQTVIFKSYTQKETFSFLAIQPIVSMLAALPLHTDKTLELIETSETYTITNITINDTASGDEFLGIIKIDIQSQTAPLGNCPQDYTIV
jgi:hypothetical protein